jgi:hypothetical protein
VDNLENEKINFSVYPNPVSERLFVKLLDVNVDLLKMTINDLNGRTMMVVNNTDLQNSIDVSMLPQGVYFVQLMDNKTKSISTRKFVKM